MIYLTGDVHNLLNPKLDQLHCGVHEPTAALHCARLAAEAGVRLTYFVTGRALLEAGPTFEEIHALGNVEFGGHGWDSFVNHRSRSLLWCMCGSRYGPRVLQRHEIAKTKAAFNQRLGLNITAWRGHAYYADANTYSLLARAGIRIVSDHVDPDMRISELLPGLWCVPINTLPDHDSVTHGPFTPALAEQGAAVLRALRYLRAEPPLSRIHRLAVLARRACRRVADIPVLDHSGERLYAVKKPEVLGPSEWEQRMRTDIEHQMATAGFATLLLHPVCMAVLDNFATFRRLVSFCRTMQNGCITQALSLAHRGSSAYMNSISA